MENYIYTKPGFTVRRVINNVTNQRGKRYKIRATC